jgi:glyoxylate/hydroxypyruvate reductase A
MALLIAIADWDDAAWAEALAVLRARTPLRIWPDLGEPADIRYALAWKPPHGLMASLPNLKAVISMGAGVDHLLADPSLPAVPVVRYSAEDLRLRMRDYIVQNVMMHLRRHADYAAQQRERVWRELAQPLASEVRVGFMGLGNMASGAIEILVAMGFALAGWARSPRHDMPFPVFAGRGQLPAFLERTDILVCTLPLTPETRGILNALLLRGLARGGPLPGPVLINAGRGGLQVEADILACLADGTLHAASLDVFEEEPLPATSPLWAHPRVFVTPHNAAWSSPMAVARFALEQIDIMEAGGTPASLADRARGY